MEQFMPYIWLVLAVLLAIVEVSTSQLVSVWFVAGALVSALCSATFLSSNILLQLLVFIVVSALALILTRPFVKKLKNTHKTPTNADRYIGEKGIVIQEINPECGTGLVEVDGAKWTARASDGSVISMNTTVLVDSIQGVKLMVTPLKEKESEE